MVARESCPDCESTDFSRSASQVTTSRITNIEIVDASLSSILLGKPLHPSNMPSLTECFWSVFP